MNYNSNNNLNNNLNKIKSLNNLKKINNNLKKINSLNNLINYTKTDIINNLDNLLKIKDKIMHLPYKLDKDIKNKTMELNKSVDIKILIILKNKIKVVLKNYLDDLPEKIKYYDDLESLYNSSDYISIQQKIQYIYTSLSKYYIKLENCYGVETTDTEKKILQNYFKKNHIDFFDSNKCDYKDYIEYMEYDKCHKRILQNIRCCAKIIIYLMRFDYNSEKGFLFIYKTKNNIKYYNITQEMLLDIIKNTYIIYNIDKSDITDFNKLNKIVNRNLYYYKNNEITTKLIKDNCIYNHNFIPMEI
jgi:hypothetical protein